ncbi:MAG: large repetitive protein, partial [bacterium]
GTIDAIVLTRGSGFVAFGKSVARNLIGFSQTAVDATYSTASGTRTLAHGDTVLVAGGPRAGDVFRYTGPSATSLDLTAADFSDTTIWEQLGLSAVPAGVQASVEDSSIASTGALALTATGSQRITAHVLSMGQAISSEGAVTVGGAGVFAQNKIASHVKALIDGDGPTGINVAGVTLIATDASGIEALAGAASIAGSARGPVATVAVALAMTKALNEVGVDVDASIRNADQGDTALQGISLSATAAGRPLFEFTGLTPLDLDAAAASPAASAPTLSTLAAKFGQAAHDLPVDFKLVTVRPGLVWQITGASADGQSAPAYYVTWNGSAFQVTAPTIDAQAFAASLAVTYGSTVGVSFSGAATEALNAVTSNANAHVDNSRITSNAGLDLTATSNSTINALVLAISATVAGNPGVGASIGVATAKNLIGHRLDGTASPNEVQAYVSNSTVTAGGALAATALASETIGALVLAPSVAITAKGPVGIAASGSGVSVENKIAAHVRAYLDGDAPPSGGPAGISAASIALIARDTSSIVATAVAPSLAASLLGSATVAISVAVTLARNEIDNVVETYVANATQLLAATQGDITLEASSDAGISAVAAAASLSAAFLGSFSGAVSGAGADATNIVRTATTVHVDDAVVRGAAAVRLTATDDSEIEAIIIAASIAAAGPAGVGASVGTSLAQNLIGRTGDDGDTFSEVRAYVLRSSIEAPGTLALTATGTAHIHARVLSGAVAVAGGTRGAGVSGAGASASNVIAIWVAAVIDGDGAAGIHVGSIDLSARDTAVIGAIVGSASIAGGFGSIGVAVAVGAARAYNEIHNEVVAAIRNADAVTTQAGAVTLTAVQTSTIAAVAQAASISVSVATQVAPAFSGGGVEATNVILTKTQALIVNSDVTSAADVSLSATDTPTIDASVVSLATALGGGVFAGAVAVGVSIARNLIGWRQTPTTATHTTHSADSAGLITANIVDLVAGDTVAVTDGVRAGDVYRFLGTAAAQVDLSLEDFADTTRWQQVGLVRDPAEVAASISASSLRATALTQKATANATITADVASIAVALAVGLRMGAALAGAGVDVRNRIAVAVDASIADTRGAGIVTGGPIRLMAQDSSTITTTGGAAVVAATLGPLGAVGATIGVAQATADMSSSVQAGTRSAKVTTTGGGLEILATERAVANGTSSIAAVAAGFGLGGALSGAGARQDVNIATSTKAFVDGGALTIAGDVEIAATDGSHGSAHSLAVGAAIGLLSIAAATSVATSTVTPSVRASISSAATVVAHGHVLLSSVATATSNATTDGYAFAVAGVVAASVARATLAPTVQTSITDSVVESGGAIVLEGRLNALDNGDNAAADEHGVAAPNAALASATASSGAPGAAGGGAHATATDSGVVDVFASAGRLSAAGAVSLLAVSYAAPLATTRAIAAALGLSIGVSVQQATANGSTRAVLGASVMAAGQTSGANAIDVTARATMAPHAEGGAFGGALAAAINAATSIAIVEPGAAGDPSVRAGFGSGTVITTGAVTVLGDLVAHASAPANGITVGAIAAIGAVVSMASVNPRVELVMAGGRVSGATISFTGRLNADDAGAPVRTDAAGNALPTALATAEAAGGAVLVSGGGAGATATDGGIVDVHPSGGVLSAIGAVTLLAVSYMLPRATTRAISPAPGVSIGAAVQTATANGSTSAVLGASVLPTGGTGTSGASSVDVTALATMAPHAEGGAFGGALGGAINAAVSIATVERNAAGDPSVRAGFGSGVLIVGGPVTVLGDLLAYAEAPANGIVVAGVAAVGAVASVATVNPRVELVMAGGSVSGQTISFTGRLNADSGGSPVRVDADGAALPTALATAQAVGGSVLGAGAGAGATAVDGGTVDVNPGGGTLSAAGAVTLRAVSYALPDATTRAIAAGPAASIGVAAQTATADGTTRAVLGTSVSAAGSIDVQAVSTMQAHAEGSAFGGSLNGAINAVVSTATVGNGESDDEDDPDPPAPSVVAGFGAGVVQSSGPVSVLGRLEAKATAPALGVAGAGILAFGTVVSTAKLIPKVELVADGIVSAPTIDFMGLLNANPDGTAMRIHDEEAVPTAVATAQAISGALIAARDGAVATAIDSGIVAVQPRGTLSAPGGLSLLAASFAVPRATTLGIAGSLAVSSGTAVQTAIADGSSRAVVDGNVSDTGSVSVQVLASMNPQADGKAFGGALGGGVNAVVSNAIVGDGDADLEDADERADVRPSVKAALGDGSIVAGGIVVIGRLTAWAEAHARAINVALGVELGVSVARAIVNPLVEVSKGLGSVSGGMLLRGMLNTLGKNQNQPIRKDSLGQLLPTVLASAEVMSGSLIGLAGARATARDTGFVDVTWAGSSGGGGFAAEGFGFGKAKATTKAIPVALIPVPIWPSTEDALENGHVHVGPRGTDVQATSVTITAALTMIAEADGEASGGALAGGGSAIESNAQVGSTSGVPSVSAGLGHSTVTSSGPVTVEAYMTAQASATARGVQAAPGAAASAVISNVVMSPKLDVSIAGASVTAPSITLIGEMNIDGGGGAVAYAQAMGVSAGGGGAGASATAIDGSSIDVHVDGATLITGGPVSIVARSHAAPLATTETIAGAGLVSVGVAQQTAIANGSTRAWLDADVRGATSVEVRAVSTMDPHAEGRAFVGAAGAVASAVISTATVEQNGAGDASVVAGLGSGDIVTSGPVTVLGQLTASASAPVSAPAAAIAAAAGAAVSTATVKPKVDVTAGGSVSASSISLISRLNANDDGSAL